MRRPTWPAEFGARSRIIRTMDWLERWFPRAGWLLLFAIPGYPMCLLSGIARMRQLPFVVVNLAGTFTRLALVWWVADLFSGPLGSGHQELHQPVLDPVHRRAMFVLVAVQTVTQSAQSCWVSEGVARPRYSR